jgi:predicted ATPase
MITELKLKQYRGFTQYKLASLARVNLLVGKNNSGKTSILEAVRLLGAGGDARVLTAIARQRGEVLYDIEERESRRSVYADISHFFYGHVFAPGSGFTLSADDDFGMVNVEVVALAELADTQPMLFDDMALRSGLGIRIWDGGGTLTRARSAVVLPTEEGALSYDQALRYSRATKWKADEAIVNFISQDSLDRGAMSEFWDRIVTESREQDVVKAMRILEPQLESIVFLSGDRMLRSETRGGILVGFQGVKGRLPLGSFGEGMRRMLALAISLAKSQGGILLVDEIDTGLHYSIMGDMWLLVVEAAIRYDIQVFVTTHSFDCIRGLAWLCGHHPNLQREVSLQKIEHELDQAVALDAEQIMIAVEQNLEVR